MSPLILRRAGGVAGIAGPGFLAATMIVLTIHQKAFLTEVGWSPVHRTPTEWPSLLALGPNGRWMSVAFGFAALCTGLLAGAFGGCRVGLGVRSALIVVALGLAGVCFPADLPSRGTTSWHAHVHNAAYPLVPLGIIAAATLLAASHPGPGGASRAQLRQASMGLASLMVVAFALTTVDSIAQLSRFLAFGSALAWSAAAGAERWLGATYACRRDDRVK